MPPALAQKPHPSPRNSFSTQPPTRHRQTSALAHPSLAPRAAPGPVQAHFLPEAAPVLELLLPSTARTSGSIPSNTGSFGPGPSRPCLAPSPPHPALSTWPAGVLSPEQPRCVPQPLHPTLHEWHLAGLPHPSQHALLSPPEAGPSTVLPCTGGALAFHPPRPTAIPPSCDLPRPQPTPTGTFERLALPSAWRPFARQTPRLAVLLVPASLSQHPRPQRSRPAPNLYHLALNPGHLLLLPAQD